jgi:phosphoglycerate dehydrogenase-like enzyme
MDSTTNVAVCSRSFSGNLDLRARLLARYQNVKFNDDGLSLSGDELVKFLNKADKAIIGLEVINRSVLAQLPDLKVIGKYGVGLDKLDFDALEEFGVQLGWTPGVNARSVAELAVNLMLTLVRKSHLSQRLVEDGEWRQIVGRELSSMVIGILGCGNVGEQLIRILRGFGCRVVFCDLQRRPDVCVTYEVTQVEFSELVKTVDVLSLHLPKNASTENIISARVLADMKDGSFIINTARGGLIEEKLLLAGLESGKLAGVGLDVFTREPPDYFDLIHHENCIVTSHIGGSSEEAIFSMGMAAIEGLDVFTPAKQVEQYA